jgi:serine/threonine protein kinase
MMSNNCPPAEVLGRYAVGALSDAEANTVDTHIGHCTACLERLVSLDEAADGVMAALRKLPHAVPDTPTELARAVAAAQGGGGPPPAPGLELGTVVNGYRVVEELGRGGMGRVYRAAHPRLDQEVALKVLRPGLDSAPILARFEAERQALARMDHPNVARVLDGGATPDGRPYFAMELVRGVAVTRYCDDHRLDVRGRLDLFVAVCRAVQHAHQKGIIHRDLKPSNVLVAEYDGRPAVKVIDFGVAKATDRSGTAETEVGVLVGTPESMSPEQAALTGADVDTRTDVYALGGLLYELLSGDTPFERARLRGTPVLEVLRIVREEEPPAPSTRLAAVATEVAAARGADPARLAKLLRGELDWITLKALEKDRSRRYETAAALADDVGRYLRHEPVAAGPPSASYRVRKFVRRNRAAVIAAGLVVAALVAGTVGTTAGLVRANRERDDKHAALDAESQARKQAIAALVSLTDDVVEYQLGRRETLTADERAFLKRIAEQFDAFASLRSDLEEIRATRALGTGRLGVVQYRLGELPAAQEAMERARTMYEQLAADFPANPEYRLAVGNISRNLWLVLDPQGRHAEAEAAILHARDVLRPLADEFPNLPGIRYALARCRIGIRIVLERQSNLAAAEAENRLACVELRQLADAFPGVADYRNELAHGHQGLAALLRTLGRFADSAAEYRTALALLRKLAADFPGVPIYRRLLIAGHTGLGGTLGAAKKYGEAEAENRRSLDLAKALAADFPAVPDYRQEVPSCHNNLGAALNDQGKLSEAEAEYRTALQYHKQLVADFPGRPAFRQSLARAHNNLGNLLLKHRKYAEAETEQLQAIDVGRQLVTEGLLLPRSALEFGAFCINFAQTLTDSTRTAESLDWYGQGIETLTPIMRRQPTVIENRNYLRNGLRGRAVALAKLQRHAEALADWDRALELADDATRRPFRVMRVASMARVDPARTVAEVESILREEQLTTEGIYRITCALCVASTGLADTADRERVAHRVVDYLGRLQAKGFFANGANAERLKSDAELGAVRDRDDFKKLVGDVENAVRGPE